ncbi:helix-turn-helix transcriptional regulator [Anaerocolumna sp. AGMB13020]|uniref:helix-turn-helix domain-containing protein n=1 Tax=Anaerocolumna sp. AGMB13020 TaxID=3081750 RepID=UPI002952E3DA|nr:helix-turn-helix transcriptional regulator [Anaerocolumna sp. AGMB13020]WOO36050.1 helix-turn-helix transcriptional regulator [Anaerocolumna sp. AGMB13020]
MYDIFEKLLNQNGITAYKVSKDTGISTATLTQWKNGTSMPKQDKMQIIANYFGVTLDYLVTGKEISNTKEITLTKKDEKDIAKDLKSIMEKIRNGEDGSIHYDGMEIDPDSLSLLENAIEIGLKHLKIINKEKYNPKKNKGKIKHEI